MYRKMMFAILLGAAAAALGCGRSGIRSGQVAARVNGKDILRSDVDRYYRFKVQGPGQNPTGDAALLARMEIVRDLIEREIMAQKADKLKLQVKPADVEAQLQELRGTASPEEFRKDLDQRGLSEQDLRNEIQRNLTVQMLEENQIGSRLQVTDAEVHRFYDENKESFNVRERQYHLAQIVVTSNPSVPVNNATNDKALNQEQAAIKIQRLAALLKTGADFQKVARDFSEDPQTASEGGDLGYQPESSLDRLGPQLKRVILGMNAGDTTPVMQNADGFWILKLLGKREPGQKSLQDAEVNSSIHAELRNRKQQVLTAAFSEQLHNEAHVENFLAEEILAGYEQRK